jgi:uncharacterized phiE125 gp8 family phage protein
VRIEVATAATLLPVSVPDAMTFARVDEASEASVVELALRAAVEKAEGILGRRLLTTVLDGYLPEFPASGVIDLPETPVQSVTHVKYYDGDNALQTLALTTGYLVMSGTREGLVYLPDGAAWPSTYDRPDAVVIEWTAGWTVATSVPARIRQWILQAVATMYEHREHTITGTIVGSLPHDFAMGLLDNEIGHRVR